MMNPKYQARKNTVAGTTNARRLETSSWNSPERSIPCQSMSGLPPAAWPMAESATPSGPPP
jgi:hypothetical protein